MTPPQRPSTAGPLADGAPWLVDDLLRVEDILLTTAGSSPHLLVSEPALHLITAGGKRLRPALVMLASRTASAPTRATELAAAAIELVHIATLYHDDFIDGTATRRGVPTVHTRWSPDIAVLTGDYLFACGCSLGADAGGEVPGILARAIAEVCQGQIVETGAVGDPRRPVAAYLDTIRRKTAALFRAACELGAATAGAPEAPRLALCDYGDNLGLAFQVVDDLLDLVGDPRVTGKVPGTDLAEGVFTLPVLIGLERNPALVDLLGSTRALGDVLPLLEAAGAIDAALEAACSYGAAARAALAELPAGAARDALATVVEGVLAQVPGRAAVGPGV